MFWATHALGDFTEPYPIAERQTVSLGNGLRDALRHQKEACEQTRAQADGEGTEGRAGMQCEDTEEAQSKRDAATQTPKREDEEDTDNATAAPSA